MLQSHVAYCPETSANGRATDCYGEPKCRSVEESPLRPRKLADETSTRWCEVKIQPSSWQMLSKSAALKRSHLASLLMETDADDAVADTAWLLRDLIEEIRAIGRTPHEGRER